MEESSGLRVQTNIELSCLIQARRFQKCTPFLDMDTNIILELSFGKKDKIHLMFLLHTFVDVLIGRKCGNQRVDDIMREYLVVVQVFVS